MHTRTTVLATHPLGTTGMPITPVGFPAWAISIYWDGGGVWPDSSTSPGRPGAVGVLKGLQEVYQMENSE